MLTVQVDDDGRGTDVNMMAVLEEDEESADHPAFAYGAGCPVGGRREEKGKKRVGTFRSAEEGVESEESKPKKTKIFPRPCVFSCPSYI